ncbi:MAG: dihydrolipoamide acetyltransferase family protein [Actinomycetota bacterium]
MADITMPQLGETVTEGTITRWAKKVGDTVEEDEVLFEVSTDKVDSEVPSPAAGVLAEILVQEGETADVGAKLAVISDSAPAGAEAGAAASKDGSEAAGGGADGGGADGGGGGQPEAGGPTAEESPDLAAETEAAEPEATADVAPPEDHGAGAANGDAPAPAQPAREGGGGGGQALVLSPVVRRLLKEHGLQPGDVQASGAGGRITRDDVLAVVDSRSAGGSARPAEAPAPSPAPARKEAAPAAAAPAGEAAPVTARDETVPFSNIRRRTAEHMRRSLDTSAHTLVVIEVDYDGVEQVRLPARARFKEEEGVSLSYLPFIGRAVIDALHDFPRLNASVGNDELVVHHEVNLGIAVDLGHEGLIVPVIHAANDKRLRALAREVAQLAGRARSKKLSADDISGGTFTITNPGGYGTFLTAPIINQPQVAILSTDGVKPKPVAVALPGGGYGVAVHPVGNLAISFDHRAVDGAYASAFLARLREIIETRDWAQELA